MFEPQVVQFLVALLMIAIMAILFAQRVPRSTWMLATIGLGVTAVLWGVLFLADVRQKSEVFGVVACLYGGLVVGDLLDRREVPDLPLFPSMVLALLGPALATAVAFSYRWWYPPVVVLAVSFLALAWHSWRWLGPHLPPRLRLQRKRGSDPVMGRRLAEAPDPSVSTPSPKDSK